MYAGRAVEYGTAHEIFNAPQHPYTWGLLESMPTVDRRLEHPGRDRGLAAVAARAAAGLRVPSALQVPLRAVRQRAAAARADAGWTPRCVSPAGRAQARARGATGRRRARRRLMASTPEPASSEHGVSEQRAGQVPLVEIEHLTKHFPVRQGVFARSEGRSCTRSRTSR